MRFLLDEDLPPKTADVGRGLGLDVVSVHELARTGLSDEHQLAFAASERRILVTCNRDDFVALTRSFYATGRPHAGIVMVSRACPNHRPATIAHALAAWRERYAPNGPGSGFLDFL
ncbi:MAG: DUF5615 family PIN-like protein [Trueperaceae bacterium]|nr:DUF5615 family PIN-like protein [Trueperaceae bacterium]